MCGALDVGLLNEKLKDRKIIAGRAVGVRTIDQLAKCPVRVSDLGGRGIRDSPRNAW